MYGFSVEAKVFWDLPIWKVFSDRTYVLLEVYQERVKRPFFDGPAGVDDALKLLSTELLMCFSRLHYATSLIIDLPSMF